MLSILKLLTWTGSGLKPESYELIFGSIGASLAFIGAYNYHRITGVNPWKIPSALWALLAFVSPVGLVLGFVARSNIGFRTHSKQGGLYSGRQNHSMMNDSSQPLPAKNNLTDGQYLINGESETTEYKEKVRNPLFGWYPDPYKKYPYRYWDGKAWTKFISDGQARSEDKDFTA
ncbi:MAG: DUF2510 domain-containing protein [Firmicutes bacterium]|jgi:hypothetical protein|nr:DUF2510 domain-containing protein [Bacillota bacterium]